MSGFGKVFFLPTGVLGVFTGWGRFSFSIAVFFCASSFQWFQLIDIQSDLDNRISWEPIRDQVQNILLKPALGIRLL